MLTYTVKNTREETVTVDGLGVLPPGVTEVTKEQADSFKHMRGLTLAQAGMPKGVEVTVVTRADDEEKVK